MEEVCKRYEALTPEQKDKCKEGFNQAFEFVLTMLKKDEASRCKLKENLKDMECILEEMTALNIDPEIIKKRRLLLEQFKELGELEIELKWIPLSVPIMD